MKIGIQKNNRQQGDPYFWKPASPVYLTIDLQVDYSGRNTSGE